MAATDLVLLTGATGHVGYAVLKQLLAQDYTVRAAVRSSAKAELVRTHASVHAKEGQLSFVIVPDFLVDGAFDEAVKGVKYVIHVASPLPSSQPGGDLDESFIKPAVQGTIGMFASARKAGSVKRIVVTSSAVATAPVTVLFGQDDGSVEYGPDYRAQDIPAPYDNNPGVAYVQSKIAALKEAEAWVAREKPEFDVVHIHPSFILGRDDLTTTVEGFDSGTNAMVLGLVLDRAADPTPSAVVHVEDVAAAHVKALDPAVSGNQSFLLSSTGKDGMEWEQAKEFAKKHFPDAVERGLLPCKGTRETGKAWLDNSKTREGLGIQFKDFEEMVVEVVGHYLEVLEQAKKIEGK